MTTRARLEGVVAQFLHEYPGAEVAWVEGGNEAWIMYDDTIMKVRETGVLVNVLNWDWIRVPHIKVPEKLPTRYSSDSKLTPAEISTIRSWARAMGKKLPEEGLESLTQDIIDAYYNWLNDRHGVVREM